MKIVMFVLTALLAMNAPAYAEILSGKVQSVNPDRNTLQLLPDQSDKEIKLKWDENLPGAQELETAEVGDDIAVEADRGFLGIGGYKVKALNPDQSAAEAEADAGDNPNAQENAANDGRPDGAEGDVTPSGDTLTSNAAQSLKDAGETIGAATNRAAKSVDNAFERAGENAENAADDAEDTADRAADETRDAADDAEDSVDRRF